MTDSKLGARYCYICGSYLDPLTSNCSSCGYSQLPNPDDSKESRAGKLKSKLSSEIEKEKSDLGARAKLPPKPKR